MWVNEAIIDFELGFAEFERREVKMPLVGCPDCNRETMEYTGIKSPPEGR
jgi:4-hydroxy-3-methylbut-2-en-1-yl diphosphate synthase IspG/GcpE